jgi:hypothetical protein
VEDHVAVHNVYGTEQVKSDLLDLGHAKNFDVGLLDELSEGLGVVVEDTVDGFEIICVILDHIEDSGEAGVLLQRS